MTSQGVFRLVVWRLNDRSLDLEESVVVTIDLSVSFEAGAVVA